MTEIIETEIRLTKIKATKIRATEIKTSSNHCELQQAIFFILHERKLYLPKTNSMVHTHGLFGHVTLTPILVPMRSWSQYKTLHSPCLTEGFMKAHSFLCLPALSTVTASSASAATKFKGNKTQLSTLHSFSTSSQKHPDTHTKHNCLPQRLPLIFVIVTLFTLCSLPREYKCMYP